MATLDAPPNVVGIIYQAIADLQRPPEPPPCCDECGAAIGWRFGGIGFVCFNGHRLPGQDLPARTA